MVEIEVLSDEEFYAMRERMEKEKFLDSLLENGFLCKIVAFV